MGSYVGLFKIEREFENAVRRDLANTFGELIIYPKFQDTFAGFPDLIMDSPKSRIAVEFKMGKKKLTKVQRAFKERFLAAEGVNTYSRHFFTIWPHNVSVLTKYLFNEFKD